LRIKKENNDYALQLDIQDEKINELNIKINSLNKISFEAVSKTQLTENQRLIDIDELKTQMSKREEEITEEMIKNKTQELENLNNITLNKDQ